MNEALKTRIDTIIKSNPIVLFMKGSKDRPQCGFSKQVVEVLSQLVPDYESVDVLADLEIREGIKAYSSWPTIPQLYINQKFIGGCDIILDLFDRNKLQEFLGLKKATTKPLIRITQAALDAFKSANGQKHDDEAIRIRVAANFEHDLSFDTKDAHDFCIDLDGVEIVIDPYSALRANNLHIDYLSHNLESGFAFENPNEPPEVKELSVSELRSWHESGKQPLLIDVRSKDEWNKAHISFAQLYSEMDKDALEQIPKDQPIVFHCHHGGRSRRMAENFRARGFTEVYNLTGGIDAWAKQIDSSIPVY